MRCSVECSKAASVHQALSLSSLFSVGQMSNSMVVMGAGITMSCFHTGQAFSVNRGNTVTCYVSKSNNSKPCLVADRIKIYRAQAV